MNFSEKLHTLRKEKRYSQEEFAELIGVSRQAISKWESGQSYPELNNLILISQILGVSIDYLVKDEEILQTITEPAQLRLRFSEYEYKSKRTLFGVPLVHINLGVGFKKAKGIIAIGNIAVGFVALGGLSCGLVSLGGAGIGLISLCAAAIALLVSFGAVAIAPLAFGAVAIGFISFGAVAIGMFSVGALAISSHVAIGDYAYGHIAIGNVVDGFKTIVGNADSLDSVNITAESAKVLIKEEFPWVWDWVVNLITFILK